MKPFPLSGEGFFINIRIIEYFYMKTFKIFLENAAENLAVLRASGEDRKQEIMKQIASRRQQKKEDEELENTINREIEEREKAAKNKRKPTKSEDQKR